jgi:predicted transcriptional regulator
MMNKEKYISMHGIDPIGMMESVLRIYDVDLHSKSRDRFTSDLRKMFCAFLYKNSRMTIKNISNIVGKSIGNVSYYLSSHDLKMINNVAYAERYDVFQDKMRKDSAQTI